jgi:hypothetical protein
MKLQRGSVAVVRIGLFLIIVVYMSVFPVFVVCVGVFLLVVCISVFLLFVGARASSSFSSVYKSPPPVRRCMRVFLLLVVVVVVVGSPEGWQSPEHRGNDRGEHRVGYEAEHETRKRKQEEHKKIKLGQREEWNRRADLDEMPTSAR